MKSVGSGFWLTGMATCYKMIINPRRVTWPKFNKKAGNEMGILNRLFVVAGLMFVFATPASAYLDPSVMTYTVQVVAGVVVAVGAVAGIYWRKAKKKVQDTLGIDENAKKEVEDDVIETDGDNNK